ncbi:DoxX family protein [Gilvimarinus sp. SDUM040013]|uniref:DoxX family protein n=1 Tax=Gilvimarinus gilvus TaxID=3058038 RepID=A0ABU4RV86_9GAMM|nr:DoxX family protein [Gilvimarinus sp. SDUM040013]MDO3386980.1 DoxX family protein [Gilvimarinus sp. SDUM040013]MDX6848126.1 DoxX family protein [Gilvimarinus sp. SDUM040013]
MIDTAARWHLSLVNSISKVDSLAGLALRLYLAPIFWMAGTSKLAHFNDTVAWFGNPDWGLGLPLPWLMAFLATATELVGAVLLALGLFTRLIAVPLIVTMVVAIVTVHWDYGWQAIADVNAPFATDRVTEAAAKLERANSILREHGHYEWLTSSGKFVVLNNGIEFAATYLIMLLALLAWGPGRYFSLDYYLAMAVRKHASKALRE